METFRLIIDKWPNIAALAEDLGEKPETVRKWRTRGRIPAAKWDNLCHAGSKRNINISLQTLAAAVSSDSAVA